MIRLLLSLICLASLAAPGSARAQAAPVASPSTSLRIHFAQGSEWAPLQYETVKGVILLHAEIDGRPATILLDNGSDRSIVDTGFATRAGIKLGAPAPSALTGSATRLPTRLTDSVSFALPRAITVTGTLVAIDIGAISTALGRQVDGVLGADVLGNLAIMVDPDKQRVSIVGSGDITPGSNAIVIAVVAGNQIDATINGQPVRLRLDLGYNGVVRISDAAWQRIFTAETPMSADSMTAADGINRATRRTDGELVIGGVSLKPAPISSGYATPGPDGVLGNRFISRFVAIFDGPKKQFILVPRGSPTP